MKPQRFPLPDLPTLPMNDWGHRLIDDPETGEPVEAPLTLLELLYPSGEEIAEPETLPHSRLRVRLQALLTTHLSRNWLVFGNVYVHWGRPTVPPKAPDITCVRGAGSTGEDTAYYAGYHGPTPQFVIEIASPTSQQIGQDRDRNRIDYAALGIVEYLVIDICSAPSEPWELLGYRLSTGPFYDELAPDANGGVTFPDVGLRFVPVGRERVDIYDVQSRKRLPTYDI